MPEYTLMQTIRGDEEFPFKSGNALQVTPAVAAGIGAFIRELKPGIYVKCSNCQRMKHQWVVAHFQSDGTVLCDGCA